MPKQTADITEALTPENPETRKKVRNVAAALILVVGAGLLIDDQVKKFKNRKSVKVVVEDKPEA